MCRLFGLAAKEPVRATVSLLHARKGLIRETIWMNRDGWGLGHYVDGVPHVEKLPEPAAGSKRFKAAVRQARSTLILGHVRHATKKPVRRHKDDTHPFRLGTWLLGQNGGLGKPWHRRIRADIRLREAQPRSGTSGELLLHWLHARAGHLTGAARTRALVAALGELQVAPIGITSANFVLTTGDALYAYHFTPSASDQNHKLHYLKRPVRAQVFTSAKPNVQLDLTSLSDATTRVVLVASTPLDPGENWIRLPNRTLLEVSVGPTIRARTIPVPAAAPLRAAHR